VFSNSGKPSLTAIAWNGVSPEVIFGSFIAARNRDGNGILKIVCDRANGGPYQHNRRQKHVQKNGWRRPLFSIADIARPDLSCRNCVSVRASDPKIQATASGSAA